MEIVKNNTAELEAKEPSYEDLDRYEKMIEENMERVKAALSANEDKIMSSALSIDKMNEIRLRQLELGNCYAWLVQIKQNRIIGPRDRKKRIIKPGI